MNVSHPPLTCLLTILCTLALVPGATALAQSSGTGFTYQPPPRGAPSSATRVGGGTRGLGDRTFALSVLSPDHVGLTTREQPTLYWFASEAIDAPTELSLIDAHSTDTLLETKLKPPIAPGIHALDLASHGVRLETGKVYQWFVAIVLDPERRSSDIVAAGEIERVATTDELRLKLAAAQGTAAVGVYAQAGLWYDTVAELGTLIERRPRDGALREQRAALLAQVGLNQAAGFERRAR